MHAMSASNLHKLQQHIVELCQEDVQDRSQELKRIRDGLGEVQYGIRKEHILKKMQNLVAGNTSSSVDGMVEHEGGEVHTDPESIARILTKHWQSVFSEKQVDVVKMQE